MASLSIRCGGNNFNFNRCSNRAALPSHNNLSRSLATQQQRRASISTTVKSRLHHLGTSHTRVNIANESSIGYEKIDEWMRESVKEIVETLRDAPLLVQVFSDNNGLLTKLTTEKAIVDDWPILKSKWNRGDSPLPQGVMLVEELKENEEYLFESEIEEERGSTTSSRAWGIVIQGKGVDIGPVCYLLKTSQVSSGLGLFCTHFCLVRVNSFRESAESLLTNCWLLN